MLSGNKNLIDEEFKDNFSFFFYGRKILDNQCIFSCALSRDHRLNTDFSGLQKTNGNAQYCSEVEFNLWKNWYITSIMTTKPLAEIISNYALLWIIYS